MLARLQGTKRDRGEEEGKKREREKKEKKTTKPMCMSSFMLGTKKKMGDGKIGIRQSRGGSQSDMSQE